MIGLGPRGRKHLDAYRELPQVSCRAICDADLPRARAVASESAIPNLFGSARALYRSGTVDAVSICTPSPTHFSLVAEAIASNLHVLCEKPIAQGVAQCDELIRSATERGLIIASTLQSRFFGRTEWLLRQIGSGGFGEALIARGSGWTVHVWDILLHLLGPLTEVRAHWTGGRQIDHDPIIVVARAAAGSAVAVEASPVHFRKLPGQRDRIQISGSRGACAFEIWSDRTELFGVDPLHGDFLRRDLQTYLGKRGPIEPGVPEIADFVRAVRDGSPPRVGLSEARRTIEFVCAAYISAARGGAAVALPLDPQEPQYASPSQRIPD